MESFLQSKVPSLFTKYNLTLSSSAKQEEVYQRCAFYIYNLMVNICALIATVSTLHDPTNKKVKPSHIQSSLLYVQEKCQPQLKKMKGGSYHVDGEYFGKDSSVYQEQASGHTMDQVHFGQQLARPELSSSFQKGGNGMVIQEFSTIIIQDISKEPIFSLSHIQDLFTTFDVSIKKHSLEKVQQILHMHLHCFLHDLKEMGNVSVKRLDKVAQLSRHAVFQ